MRTLSSRDNPHIKLLHELASSARERRLRRLTLLDGAHLVAAARACGWPIHEILVSDEGLANPEIVRLLDEATGCITTTHVLGRAFAHISPVDTPSGIVALIDYPADDGAPRQTMARHRRRARPSWSWKRCRIREISVRSCAPRPRPGCVTCF